MSFEERIELAPGYAISRVIRGGWQLAGGHGAVDREAVQADLLDFYRAGVTTFDCADIYTGVEQMIGDFRAATLDRFGADALAQLKVHTKFVPDLDVLPRIDRAYVRGVIERSLRRLRTERLDLVQFHWWDYTVQGWIEAAGWLHELRAEGKIDLVGGTNFDAAHLEALAVGGAPLAALQVQYSLLDRRPERTLVEASRRLGVGLLCYGTVAGGFLSERWLGRPEPTGALENRSLTKYKLIIDDFGGWPLFQDLLQVLAQIARRRGVDIAAVASRYILDRPGVAAVIVGARSAAHLPALDGLARLRLLGEDQDQIAAVLAGSRPLEGEVYGLERDRGGRHGAAMKYNLNDAPNA
jgi:aryl-alcohol dehydrogenase-like predicted oxidoreductase